MYTYLLFSSHPVLTGGDDSMGRWIVEMTDVEFFEKIGQGGYGAVFRGALKVIPDS